MENNKAIFEAAKAIMEQNQSDLIEIYKELSKQIIELKLWEYEIMNRLGVDKATLNKIQKHIDKEIKDGFKKIDGQNE